MTATNIIIDGNSLAYAAQALVERDPGKRMTCEGRDVTAIFGTLRSIKTAAGTIREHHVIEKIIVTWDSRAQWRRELYPAYKGNRDTEERNETVEALKAQRSDIEQALTLLGIDQIRVPGSEADDLAAMLTDISLKKAKDVVLVSNDKDWAQLIQDNVYFHSPLRASKGSERKLHSLDTFHELAKHSISPEQFVDMKALMGDSSDNIPGVGGIGEKGAAKLLESWGSVDAFLEAKHDGKLPKALECLYYNAISTQTAARGEVIGSRDIFIRNRLLMDLRHGKIKINRGLAEITKGHHDLDGFEKFCTALKFGSILRTIYDWEKTFYRG